MEPATTIVKKFGGPRVLAELLRVHRSRVYAWMRSKEEDGTGGLIPQRYHPKLLQCAKLQGIKLKAEDFLPVPEVAA
jgi:hypothetical protein